MDLTVAQKQALQAGSAVPSTIVETPCIVIRRDLYERVQRLFSDDFDSDETYRLMKEVLGEDAGFDRYQHFKAKP